MVVELGIVVDSIHIDEDATPSLDTLNISVNETTITISEDTTQYLDVLVPNVNSTITIADNNAVLHMLLPDPGGMDFGEETPTYGEEAISWQTWSNGSGGIPTIIGDPDWGTLELQYAEEGRSRVYDFTNDHGRGIKLTPNRYKPGQGSATPQIRGAKTIFTQDDNVLAWIDYVGETAHEWQYVQMRVIKQS